METSEFVTLRNLHGLIARFSPYGARWVGMIVPDQSGILDDVLLGFANPEEYKSASEPYYGAVIGRVCGRICKAQFGLNGHIYHLSANENGVNHLHGGIRAFHNVVWQMNHGTDFNGDEYVLFMYCSPAGEEGFPGNLQVEVCYTLRADDVLRMVCTATCDEDTVVNLTNHAFFNLCGSKRNEKIFHHKLFLNSSYLIECNEELLPTGRLLPLDNTLLDFRKPMLIGKALHAEMFRIENNRGFSLAYALDAPDANVRLAATLSEAESGRQLAIYTNQPSLQVYTGYGLDGSDVGKGGFPYELGAGIALEPQGFPDAINHPCFPSIVLRKGEIYLHVTEYRWNINRL